MFGRVDAVWLAEADNFSILAATAAEKSLCSRIRLRFRQLDAVEFEFPFNEGLTQQA